MPGLSQEEGERWIEALGGRIQWHVERLVGAGMFPEIESDAGAASNQRGTESAHPRDDPRVTRPAPPPTNQGIEEKH
jgi:hypothetical protein